MESARKVDALLCKDTWSQCMWQRQALQQVKQRSDLSQGHHLLQRGPPARRRSPGAHRSAPRPRWLLPIPEPSSTVSSTCPSPCPTTRRGLQRNTMNAERQHLTFRCLETTPCRGRQCYHASAARTCAPSVTKPSRYKVRASLPSRPA